MTYRKNEYRENAKPDFKSELKKLNQTFEIAQHRLLQEELNALEQKIKSAAQNGHTSFTVAIRRDDIKRYGFMWRKIRLLNDAKWFYDKFVELGFNPIIDTHWPRIYIAW